MQSDVKKLRVALKMRQEDLGRAIGKSTSSIQGYEAGKNIPNDVVEKLADLAEKQGLIELADSFRLAAAARPIIYFGADPAFMQFLNEKLDERLAPIQTELSETRKVLETLGVGVSEGPGVGRITASLAADVTDGLRKIARSTVGLNEDELTRIAVQFWLDVGAPLRFPEKLLAEIRQLIDEWRSSGAAAADEPPTARRKKRA